MISLVSIPKIIIWFLIIPFILGLCANKAFPETKKEGISFCITFSFGFAIMLAVFQIIAVPMIVKALPFHVLSTAWMVIILILSVISLAVNYKEIPELIKNKLKIPYVDRTTKAIFIAAVLVIIFETWLLTFNMHTDTDDVRFISEALEAYELDTMLHYHPITGDYLGRAIGEMVKEINSPYPFFIAVMSKMIGVVPAVTAHLLFPMVLIPLCYMVAFLISGFFFGDKKRERAVFMFILSIIMLFSFESVYALGYTLLTIIWQGRSIVATIMLPLLWYMLMNLMVDEKINAGKYLLTLVVYMACANLSGMGIVMSLCLGGIYAVSMLLIKKSFKKCLLNLVLLAPSAVYFAGIIYVEHTLQSLFIF